MGAFGEGAVARIENETPAQEFVRVTLDLLQNATTEFYRDRGVSLTATAAEIEKSRSVSLPMGSTIGFVGDSARGTLAIAPDRSVATESHPTGEFSPEALGDWVAETANQVFGRLKNRLLAHGVELLCDTPILVAGQARLGGIRRPAYRLSFEGPSGNLNIWLDIQVDDDIQLSTDATAVPEGALVMF